MARTKKSPGEGEHSTSTSPLTFRQRLFVEAYLGPAGGNATEAARIAGFAHPLVQSSRLLGNVRIQAAIDARLAEAALARAAHDDENTQSVAHGSPSRNYLPTSDAPAALHRPHAALSCQSHCGL